MSKPLILGYHRIIPKAKRDYSLCVTEDDFIKQLKYYLNQGYKCLTLQQYYELQNNPKKSNQIKYFIITFDDGYQDNYYYAFPILKKFQLTATIFVTTGYIDMEKPFWFDYKNFTDFTNLDFCLTGKQLKEMSDYGIEFGSHTVNHLELPKLTNLEIVSELTESKKTLEKILNKEILSFCYPRGAYTPEVSVAVKKAGYSTAVLTRNNITHKIPESLLALERISLYGHNSYWQFLIKNLGFIRKFRNIVLSK